MTDVTVASLDPPRRIDAIDRALHVGRRRCFSGVRASLEQARAGLELVRLGKVHGDDALPAPGNAAAADGRFEQGECVRHDGAYRTPAGASGLGESCYSWGVVSPPSSTLSVSRCQIAAAEQPQPP